jgi:hypothetical protein
MLIATLLLVQSAALPPRSHYAVDEVVAAVSRNVKEFQELLPDFVCNEQITSTEYESGKVKESKTVASIFTAVQAPSPGPGNSRLKFTETREITAIDGKPARRGSKMPKLPLAMFGGFGSLLGMTFSPRALDFHTYALDPSLDEGSRLAVHFETKEGQREVRYFMNGEGLTNKDTGTAWIDSNSMQVARLQRSFLSLPRGLRQLSNTVEYGPTMIGDRQFWLPRAMKTDTTETKTNKTFVAEYTNCKKFVADIRIVP